MAETEEAKTLEDNVKKLSDICKELQAVKADVDVMMRYARPVSDDHLGTYRRLDGVKHRV